MTGICPQHDVLFDQLTPCEHLAFYAKIRVRCLLFSNHNYYMSHPNGYFRGSHQKRSTTRWNRLWRTLIWLARATLWPANSVVAKRGSCPSVLRWLETQKYDPLNIKILYWICIKENLIHRSSFWTNRRPASILIPEDTCGIYSKLEKPERYAQIPSPHISGSENWVWILGYSVDNPLYGWSGPAGRPEGHHQQGKTALFGFLPVFKEQIWSRLSFDVKADHFYTIFSFLKLLWYHRFVLNENFHDTEAIRQLVSSYIPEAQVSRHFGRELSYVLPREQVATFPTLFAKLEELVSTGKASEMGYESYGVSMTTLEEVFLKLGEEAELAEKARQANTPNTKKKKGNKMTENLQSEYFTLLKSMLSQSSISGSWWSRNDLTRFAIPRAHLSSEEPGASPAEDNHNATWELLRSLDVPIRKKHKGQTLKALLKVRGINMARDPMAVFFQVFMPVAFGINQNLSLFQLYCTTVCCFCFFQPLWASG